MNVLLVSGSRSLVDRTGAPRALAAFVVPLLDGADLAVFGDATGPDLWAEQEARIAGVPTERWQLNGRVVESRYPPPDRRWYPESEPPAAPARLPLERNAAMIRSIAKRAQCGANVLCVGFVDPKSRTNGTDHTLRLARQAGIWCARYVWTGEGFEEQL